MCHNTTRLKINDKVEVIVGKDKGRVGKVIKIERETQRIVVERLNIVKKHQKSRDNRQPGQIIEREASLHWSNVMLLCPECSEIVRIGSKCLEDGKKVRMCKKCQATIETPKK